MKLLKRFFLGAYGVVATVAILALFVGFWMVLTRSDIAIIPVAGVPFPISVPIPQDKNVVTIGGQKVYVTIAATEAERQQGLSGKSGLAANEGMLFVFPEDGVHHFWMKDMLFSIDIIWITADGTIVHIEPSLSPSSYPRSFGPDRPVRYVLEVPAGFSAVHGVTVGDNVGL